MTVAAAILLCLGLSISASAQEIIDLPHESPTTTTWANPERQYFSEILYQMRGYIIIKKTFSHVFGVNISKKYQAVRFCE